MVVVDERWSHHSPHSGYCHFVDYLPGAATIRYVLSNGSKNCVAVTTVPDSETALLWVGDRAFRLPISRRFIRERLSNRGWYPLQSLLAEVKVVARMRWSSRTLYHLSYAEDQLGLLVALGWPSQRKVVATFHLPPSLIRSIFQRDQFARWLDGAIAVASNQVEVLSDLVGPERVFLIPHGVDTTYWMPGEGTAHSDKGHTILSVGAHRRDFEAMEKTVSAVRDAYEGALEVVIVTAREHADRVTSWSGIRVLTDISEPELRELYRSAAVTFVPLVEGTVNNAMLESLACGTPVVASDLGAVRDLSPDGAGVVATAPGDPGAMADAILAILRDPRKEARSQSARRQAEGLEWATIAAELATVYRRVLDGPNAASSG